MYNHKKAQQSKNRVHISWDVLYLLVSKLCFIVDDRGSDRSDLRADSHFGASIRAITTQYFLLFRWPITSPRIIFIYFSRHQFKLLCLYKLNCNRFKHHEIRNSAIFLNVMRNGPFTRYVKWRAGHAPGLPVSSNCNVNRGLNDPGIYHDKCVAAIW